MEQFWVIQSFLCTVPQGRKVVEEGDRVIAAYVELHDLKDVVLVSQRQLEGIQSRVQGSSGQHEAWQRALWNLE